MPWPGRLMYCAVSRISGRYVFSSAACAPGRTPGVTRIDGLSAQTEIREPPPQTGPSEGACRTSHRARCLATGERRGRRRNGCLEWTRAAGVIGRPANRRTPPCEVRCSPRTSKADVMHTPWRRAVRLAGRLRSRLSAPLCTLLSWHFAAAPAECVVKGTIRGCVAPPVFTGTNTQTGET